MSDRSFIITAPYVSVKKECDEKSETLTQFLYGEKVKVHGSGSGYLYVTSEYDDYLGFIRDTTVQVVPNAYAPNYRVKAPGAFVFPEPDIKKAPIMRLPFGASFQSDGAEEDGKFIRLKNGGYLYHTFTQPFNEPYYSDPLYAADMFVGVPYLWGGRTFDGLDCSALIQLCHMAVKVATPRDSGPQEEFLTIDVTDEHRRPGDIVFWKGHVGIMRTPFEIIHANAHHMKVTRETLSDVCNRSETPITSVKRLAH